MKVTKNLKVFKTLHKKDSIKRQLDTAGKDPSKFMQPTAVNIKKSKM